MLTIDADQHIFEPRTMWRDHIDPAFRDKALAIEDDELGWAHLTWRGRRLAVAESQKPMRPKELGATWEMRQRGERAPERYDDTVPASYTDAHARLTSLDAWGLDAAVLFPNFGLLWEDMLDDDVPAVCANMRASNRWMADVAHDGGGRLHPVAHMTLRDTAWAVEEIANLDRAGIRLAMVGPSPVDGKPLSHPDLFPVWDAFCRHGVTPVFHVGGFVGPLHPAWYTAETEPTDRLLDSVFLWVAPAVALTNLITQGTFVRFPELRVGVVELSAHWIPQFLMMLDGASEFYAQRHGGPLNGLPERPSHYFREHVRVSALAYEMPGMLAKRVGDDMLMFGSDWPHSEGIERPLADYEQAVADMPEAARTKVMSGNVQWLLRADA